MNRLSRPVDAPSEDVFPSPRIARHGPIVHCGPCRLRAWMTLGGGPSIDVATVTGVLPSAHGPGGRSGAEDVSGQAVTFGCRSRCAPRRRRRDRDDNVAVSLLASPWLPDDATNDAATSP